MTVKAVNNTTSPNSLVPTLLVFGTYLRLIDQDLPSPSITQRAEVIRTTIKEVRRLYIERQVQDVLTMYNGLNTKAILNLLLQLDVRVQRKKDRQQGLYKLIITNSKTCTIKMLYRPTNFRITIVKPYYTEDLELEKPQE